MMKHWFLIAALCPFIAGCSSPKDCACSAPAAAHPQPADISGDYAGSWSSSDNVGGALHLSLTKPANAPWQAKFSFTYEGHEAATTVKSLSVNGSEIELAYDYQIQDAEGSVIMTGKLTSDKTLQGSYKITSGNGVPGTWEAKRN